MKKVFEFEDRVKKWIETERVKWYSILFIIGLSLGFLFDYSLVGEFISLKKGFYFGAILMTIEFIGGGGGID